MPRVAAYHQGHGKRLTVQSKGNHGVYLLVVGDCGVFIAWRMALGAIFPAKRHLLYARPHRFAFAGLRNEIIDAARGRRHSSPAPDPLRLRLIVRRLIVH